MRTPLFLAQCLLVGSVGCGQDDSNNVGAAVPAADEADVAAYLDLVYRVDSAGATYGRALAEPALTQELCRVASTEYDRAARTAIGEMLGRADELDDLMRQSEGGFYVDMQCTARAMMVALDQHNNVACMWTDVDRDRTEANTHLTIMMGHVDHTEARCQQMLAGMGGAGWNWSPLVGCFE